MKQKIYAIQDVKEAFAKIGKASCPVSVPTDHWDDALFLEKYKNTTWYLLFNPKFGYVLNALTDLGGENGLFWESFAIVDDIPVHWLHFLYERYENPLLWYEESIQSIKPDEVYGKHWYAYKIHEMLPYLMRTDISI